MADEEFDAVVVGASLAGCTTSILLARSGAKVALVERHAQPESHKRICTHFIQASALPVLKTLGLDRLIEEAGGVRNPIELHTASGWVGSHLEQSADGAPDHGYNIRRLRLDPMVRALAARTPGVTLMTGRPAAGLTQVRGRVSGVRLGGTGEARCFGARLVVAADGRNSALAEMAGAPTKSAVNHRHAVLAPLRRVDRRRGETSQMWLHGAEVAYVFPNDDGVTVLAWMGPKDILEKHQGEPLDLLKAKIRALPDAPQLQHAEVAGDVLSIKDYPNLWRPPVVRGMALVGDAMLSVDYLWGVGCGWAFQTGAWLAEAVAADLKAGSDLTAGLARYQRRCSALSGHRFLINDFAKRSLLNPVERLMFAAAAKDVGLARHLNRFGARIDGPSRFLSPKAISRAIWVNMRRRIASEEGTRTPLAAVAPRPPAGTSTP